MDQGKVSKDSGPITSYYLWLPYLLSFLFLLCKLPHSIWKKFFENQLIRHILAGREENWDQNWVKSARGGDGSGSQNQQQGGGQKQQQGGGSGGGKKQNNQPQGWKLGKAEDIANKFILYRDKYNAYQLSFAFWETFNLLTVLASIQITHWLLNHKFWLYGAEVIYYLHYYQSFQHSGEKLHDPMCEVFPTEVRFIFIEIYYLLLFLQVGCAFSWGGEEGGQSHTEILCILGNNLFNQKYFFILWLWWMFLLVISLLGLIFRLLRIFIRAFSKAMLMRKSLGKHFNGVRISSSEAFVLELVLDNLGKTPTFATKVMRDVAARLKETHLKEYDDSFSCAQTPLMKSIDVSNHDYDEKSFYTENINSSGEANLINLREDAKSKNEIEINKEFNLDPDTDMSSDDKKITDVTPKLSAKQRKKLKKEAKQLAKTLEPLASVKEENEENEVLVKTEEPPVEAFPPLYHPSDTSVVSFPDPSNTTREWL